MVVDPSRFEGIEPWRDLDRQRRVLLDEIKEKSKIFLSDHEVMRTLNSQLADTERKMGTELKVLREKFYLELAKLKENLENLESRMPEYYAITEKMGKTNYAYSSIAEQKEMWEQARDKLGQKLASISFSEDFDWIQLRYDEMIKIRDKIPISPNKRKLAMITLIVALAGAFGSATVLNLLDTSANSMIQLEEYTGLVGIGIVPMTSIELLEDIHRSPALGAEVPNYLLECFRLIRSNICLHPNSEGRSQVVLVTSSRPQEGKTTQAANLAWAFQSMGEKTILLDCDLRRGRQHDLIKVNNSPGMTHLLMGDCSLENAVISTGVESFDVIPRGPVIAGTTDIFSQPIFKNLIDILRQKYDRIIIDSPPALGLSETASLQHLIDGTVLVVLAEKTSRKDVVDAIRLLKKSKAHFFGFVLNAVDLSKISNYYNYYYYSAPYYDQMGPREGTLEPAQSPVNSTVALTRLPMTDRIADVDRR